MGKNKLNLNIIAFLFLSLFCSISIFADNSTPASKVNEDKYKQELEQYKRELEKLKPVEDELDREKEKGLTFEDKTLRVEKVVKYQLSVTKIRQAMTPGSIRFRSPKSRELTEPEQVENKKFYAIVKGIKNVKKGVTTKKEILELFGEPHPVRYIYPVEMSPPEPKENQRVLSYVYKVTKRADSYIGEPYGVELSLSIFIDKNTDVVDDMWFMVMSWFN